MRLLALLDDVFGHITAEHWSVSLLGFRPKDKEAPLILPICWKVSLKIGENGLEGGILIIELMFK